MFIFFLLVLGLRNIDVIRKDCCRERILNVIDVFLKEIRGDRVVLENIKISGNELFVKDRKYDIADDVFVFGFGKAAGEMARGIFRLFGSRLKGGIINTDHEVNIPKVKVNIASHPLPDTQTVEYSKEIIEAIGAVDKKDFIIFLITGGASSLFEVPSVPLGYYRKVIGKALKSGKGIEKINEIRTKFSLVKGGKLLKYVNVPWISLIMSDVLGNPKYVGSGPTYNSKYIDRNVVVADNMYARKKFAQVSESAGMPVVLYVRDITFDLKDAADFVYHKNCNMNVVMGGEITVKLEEDIGIGGRNEELALFLSRHIRGTNKVFVAMGTDGKDGNSPATGAIVDGRTYDLIGEDGWNYAVNRHDSYTVLNISGDTIITGATGSNLADIYSCFICDFI